LIGANINPCLSPHGTVIFAPAVSSSAIEMLTVAGGRDDARCANPHD
jgi:hypothetical protein